jgi:hypothetical protein
LVSDEREQWRDDQSDLRAQQRGQLVGERLAGTGGQHEQGGPPTEDSLDCVHLPAAETV